jgi:hypothetical protein
VRFAEDIGWTALDEDRDDFDEVYARFSLRNHLIGVVVSRRTSVIVVELPNVRPEHIGSGVGPIPDDV